MKSNKLLISLVLLVWVVLAIVSAVSVEAFSFGALSNINKDYFSWQLWANTLLIGIAIYFTLTFLVKLKMDSKQGMWISIIMVGLVAYLIASNPIRTGGNVVFILEQPNVKEIKENFLNPNTGVIGNPQRLGVFIGSTLVFLWLFHFLNVGGKEEFSTKLNIALALLIGYNMATTGTKPAMVLAVGQMVAILIIRKNLGDAVKGNVAGWVVALIIVGWVGQIAFPGYITPLSIIFKPLYFIYSLFLGGKGGGTGAVPAGGLATPPGATPGTNWGIALIVGVVVFIGFIIVGRMINKFKTSRSSP